MTASVNVVSEQRYRIAVRDLFVHYGAREVLSDINLNIDDNAVTALVGVSGCGKSTLLRCFNRMNDYTPDCRVTGSVELDGVNIYGRNVDPVLLRTKVGLISQKPTPFPMSIYENVAYGLRLHKFCKSEEELDEIVRRSLKSAGLYDEVIGRIHDEAFGLSGGQQQRLCIARTLAINPEVILMDEPCSSLDSIASDIIDKLIIELKKKFTIILVTHSVRQTNRVADNVAFLSKGRLIESGSVKDVLSAPCRAETIDYVRFHLNE